MNPAKTIGKNGDYNETFLAFDSIVMVADSAVQKTKKKKHPKTLSNTCNMSARQIKPVQKLYTEINEACVNKNRTSAHSHEPPLSFIAGVHSVPLFLIDLIN